MPSQRVLEKLDKQDWPKLIKEATLHAMFQLKYYGLWGRRGLKGYSAYEIAMEAIEKIYAGEWRWNPDKSSLKDYLKYHVVKGLVANLARSSEFKSTDEMEASEVAWLSDDNAKDIDEELTKSQIVDQIRNQIGSDSEALAVFVALLQGYKRADICKKHNWEYRRYDNASRRLAVHIRQIADLHQTH